MNTSTTVLSIATLGLTGACAYLFYQAEDARERAHIEAGLRLDQHAQITRLEQERARLEQEVSELTFLASSRQTGKTLEEPPASPSTTASQPQQRPASSEEATVADGPPDVRRFVARRADFLNRMLNDPAARASMRSQQAFSIRSMYGDFVRESNMTAEEGERFIELLIDQQMKMMEASRSLTEDPQALASTMGEIRRETDAELLALLGSERFQQYGKYPQTLGDRMQIRQLRDQLDFGPSPLRPEQSSQLLAAMQEERNRIPQPAPQLDATNGSPERQFDTFLKWQEDYERRVRERAAQVLTPDQLERFVELQQQQANMRRMGATMRVEGRAGNVAAPGVNVVVPLRGIYPSVILPNDRP